MNKQIREIKFKVQLDESKFSRKKEVSFFGHIVAPEKEKPNLDDIIPIMDYPIREIIKVNKGFLVRVLSDIH